MQIHISGKTGTEGPFPQEKIRQMLESGELNGNEPAWTEGAPDWKPLHTLVAIHQTPPPIPPSDVSPYAPPASLGAAEPVPAPIGGPIVGPTGVGGWLLFYCISLTILSPIFTTISLIRGWQETAPAFEAYPAIKSTLILESLGTMAVVLYGFVVGCQLWNKHPNSRRNVKTFLLTRLIGLAVIEGIAILLMSGLPSPILTAGITAVIGGMVREAIHFAVWWAYFAKSKRVYNTFGGTPP